MNQRTESMTAFASNLMKATGLKTMLLEKIGYSFLPIQDYLNMMNSGHKLYSVVDSSSSESFIDTYGYFTIFMCNQVSVNMFTSNTTCKEILVGLKNLEKADINETNCVICLKEELIHRTMCGRCGNAICLDCRTRVEKCPFCRYEY